jgi:hypothetical protein
MDWSSLIAGPKVFHQDAAAEYEPNVGMDEPAPAVVALIAEVAPSNPLLLATRMQLVRDIGRTRFRRKIWIGLAAAEAVFLLVAMFKLQ